MIVQYEWLGREDKGSRFNEVPNSYPSGISNRKVHLPFVVT
ncbi:hypothetical protein ACVW1C_003320 [Bradyrhizobium sp. USDA 4011]